MKKTKNGHARCKVCSRFGCDCKNAMNKRDNRRSKVITKNK